VSVALRWVKCIGESSPSFSSLAQVTEPLAEGKSEESSLVHDYDLLVVQLNLSRDEAEMLIAELIASGIQLTSANGMSHLRGILRYPR
jgi:hypothetical protein